jgi:hypothetical protein
MCCSPRAFAKLAALFLALLAGVGLAGVSADEQTDVILSHLPSKQSAEYKALRTVAGSIGGQDLAMTGAEMWTVPDAHYAALREAAAKQGATVRRVGDSATPEVAAVLLDAEMTPAQREMMHKTMESKAAVGMSMMKLPDAASMEYALTKRMDAPTGSAPQTILIPLNETLTVTAQRTEITKTQDGYIWRGVIDGTGDPVTLLWWPSGRLAGTVMYKGHAYVIKNIEGNMHGMLELTPDKMPPDHGAASKEMMQKMGMHADLLVHDGDASMMLPTAMQPPPMKPQPVEGAPKDAEISLIVAYTKKAASHYTDIVKDMIDVAIAQTNQSFRDSGAGNVRVKLAHAYETDYVENGSHFDHVYRFRNKGDGYMDEIHGLREKYAADVAVLIVDDPMGCGLSIRVAAEAPDAFTAIHHECAATMYSLAHEIGHLIGARHDRALDDTAQPFPYGHGFVHGKQWRTMMSYQESCDGCPRRPIWSSPDVKVGGEPAGDADTNNAKVIRENAARVAAFHTQLTSSPHR